MKETAQLLTNAVELLRRAGIRIASGSLHELDLTLPDGRTRSTIVRVRRRPPTPHTLTALRKTPIPARHLLIVTPHATPHLRTLALDGEVDVIAPGENLIVLGGTRYPVAPESAPRPASAGHPARGRKPWTRWAIERLLLLTDQPMPQRELAATLDVTQQAVSLALQQCPHVHRTPAGWVADSREALLEDYLADYPGPGGATTYWYGADPVLAQAATAVEFCTDRGVTALLSGDAAADVYAPWRLPAQAVLYVPEFVDVATAGFGPASAEAHTLAVTVPADPTLWRTAAAAGEPALLADPLIAVHDVLHSSGADAHEAAEHLLAAIKKGAL
ncbi:MULTISPECIES: hypothetical protein [unclassified Rhodococcus (in: high G+C Gram-positive bacteria)]|uniref:hypothetical protein n=1 Tax=unclassified Rhodococcus (in: high G+C Gram-positive bacteria) TaxID=192944 RepID=UPI00146D222F|nr:MULTISPECIES: hypothetical protein [unclassified Rhodococcus (in: high G+C Gram-positive bacteria)]MBF0660087.1 hypothetical protein [Rhodococcus sp. (in: high G+C Gram-positive bacteria)]NMD94833.1 hypothetical protein [Rhodococcus sp. BL-253-APC-6A1W]NME81011.1 hypothetical protein [Rhodococcus sp. 105337]